MYNIRLLNMSTFVFYTYFLNDNIIRAKYTRQIHNWENWINFEKSIKVWARNITLTLLCNSTLRNPSLADKKNWYVRIQKPIEMRINRCNFFCNEYKRLESTSCNIFHVLLENKNTPLYKLHGLTQLQSYFAIYIAAVTRYFFPGRSLIG